MISGVDGLDHYEKLFNQIKEKNFLNLIKSFKILIEISPEQKSGIEKLVNKIFEKKVKISIKKDLAGKWRLVELIFDFQ